MPFDGDSQNEVFEKIRSGVFEMPKQLSEECKDLLKKMICVDPNKRISAIDAINHPWIKNADEIIMPLSKEEQLQIDNEIV
jgi:serine/threonine protein kinase